MGALFGGGGVSKTAPTVSSLRVQTCMLGKPIPLVYGTTRIAGNILQFSDFAAYWVDAGGGKGGGQAGSGSWMYFATVLVGLCAGPIGGVGTVWIDKQRTTLAGEAFNLFLGGSEQQPYAFMSANHPDQALAYRNLAYVASANVRLGDDGGFTNHSYEVTGRATFSDTIKDCSIAQIFYDLFSNSIFGAFAGLTNLTFTSDDAANVTFQNYTNAAGFFVSPAYQDQQTAGDIIDKLLIICNSALVYSAGVVKLIPYGDQAVTGNGYTYTPNNTPVYALTDDDFVDNGDDNPIMVSRINNADAYNRIQIKYYNRANDYNEDVVTAEDQAAIELFGLRVADPLEMYEICDTAVARNVAQVLLQRSLYIRNKYEFTLTLRYSLLEPMDIVTLTESTGTGLNAVPVRITAIEEDGDGNLKFTAEDFPGNVSSFVQYPSQTTGGYVTNYAQDPGDTTALIWEAPLSLTTSGLEVWIGGGGGSVWGGADVYVSNDGNSYSKIGTINAPTKLGSLNTVFDAGLDPDQLNVLNVTLTTSNSTLAGGSQADVDSFSTLAYVGGELVAYRDAALTAAQTYNLSYIRRGVYNTPISQHINGTQFARIEPNSFFKIPFTTDRIGQIIYVKLVSFNVFGSGYQLIQDVNAIQYLITGSAFLSSLPDITNVHVNYIANLATFYWDAVDDFRQPNIDYEIRIGATFATAQIIAHVPTPQFTAIGDGTYWISARYLTGGVSVYSSTPADIVVAGATITSNVIASYDESATGWTGSMTSGLVIDGTEIKLSASGDILSEADVLTVVDVLSYGGLTLTGTYTLPAGHIVSLADVAPCQVVMSYLSRGQALNDNILTVNDVFALTDVLGSFYGQYVTVVPQIAIADGSGSYGAWENYQPGVYNAKHFKARVQLTSSNSSVIAYLSDFVFSVDVPDRAENGTLTTAAGGTAVTYATVFNVSPNVQITIAGATAGDEVFLTGQSTSGFTVQVKNAGAGVARAVNWFAQSY